MGKILTAQPGKTFKSINSIFHQNLFKLCVLHLLTKFNIAPLHRTCQVSTWWRSNNANFSPKGIVLYNYKLGRKIPHSHRKSRSLLETGPQKLGWHLNLTKIICYGKLLGIVSLTKVSTFVILPSASNIGGPLRH